MARIYIGGAGGAPANGFIRSLHESSRNDYLIGASCLASDLMLAEVAECHVVPPALDAGYAPAVLSLLRDTRADFIHAQNDFEVRALSRLRERLDELGVRYFLPDARVIEDCVDKQRSWAIWQRAGLRVPNTILLHTPADLKRAFALLGDKLWLRATEGGGGSGALPTDDFEFARLWIDRHDGWGGFTASELLSPDSVTWLSIWHRGELVVAQTRKRLSWNFANRTLSGVTGVTGVGQTCSDPVIDSTALEAIEAIDKQPHGIYAVDMTYDFSGQPNPTEINIGRFFTTHFFFTRAGLNLPRIYCDIALDNRFPSLERKINPLPDDLLWIRGMDVEPVLTTLEDFRRLPGVQSNAA